MKRVGLSALTGYQILCGTGRLNAIIKCFDGCVRNRNNDGMLTEQRS